MTDARNKKKTAISLDPELLDELREREDAGQIPSVSGHIQTLLERERAAARVDETLARLFPGQTPGPEHREWAAKALGGDGGSESSAA